MTDPVAAARQALAHTDGVGPGFIAEMQADDLRALLELIPTRTVDRDVYENELLAAGATFMALLMVGARVEAITEYMEGVHEPVATTEMWVQFGFLKSRYRITVTFDPEPPE